MPVYRTTLSMRKLTSLSHVCIILHLTLQESLSPNNFLFKDHNNWFHWNYNHWRKLLVLTWRKYPFCLVKCLRMYTECFVHTLLILKWNHCPQEKSTYRYTCSCSCLMLISDAIIMYVVCVIEHHDVWLLYLLLIMI